MVWLVEICLIGDGVIASLAEFDTGVPFQQMCGDRQRTVLDFDGKIRKTAFYNFSW